TSPIKNYRKEVLNDDYYNWNNIYYGNNNIMVNNPYHGTHVAGICLSKPLSIWNCSQLYPPIKLMIIRVVPNGDEYDKDVALGIKYAVNNGANIINMSFGKSFSPEQFLVNDAIKYAGTKNVLLIHSAGNDKKDLNTNFSYPTPYPTLSDSIGLPYFITVGASSDSMLFDSIQSSFSNYGYNKVDIMAPGVKMYSSIPFKDKYATNSGTSMAGPVVTHIAALLWAYFPQLKACQIKEILLKSAAIPTLHNFNKVCTSGGIVNAFNAIKLTNQIYKNKKK
ncbi:MAG: S8 family serine peptidase, partial [Sediminibacterium sp.]|nr:S8 family serine peptidase [Sediminibacterium sp.]